MIISQVAVYNRVLSIFMWVEMDIAHKQSVILYPLYVAYFRHIDIFLFNETEAHNAVHPTADVLARHDYHGLLIQEIINFLRLSH